MPKNKPNMTTIAGLPVTGDWARGERHPLAQERALTAFANTVRNTDLSDYVAAGLAAAFAGEHRVSWERAINAEGVRVRRYVARSEWEVDPDVR